MGFQLDNRQTFAEYAGYVLGLKEQEGCKVRTLDRYKELLVRINQAIGHLKLVDIRPQHLNAFYKNLGENGLRKGNGKATAKPALLEKCSLLDDMPLAFCVIELVFNESGHGVDFIFRYCNAEMATIEGVPVEEMLNRSFYEVFPNGDKKWLVSYADVALNGTRHTLHDYSPEVDKYLTIHCYQPEPGYCACVLQAIDS